MLVWLVIDCLLTEAVDMSEKPVNHTVKTLRQRKIRLDYNACLPIEA